VPEFVPFLPPVERVRNLITESRPLKSDCSWLFGACVLVIDDSLVIVSWLLVITPFGLLTADRSLFLSRTAHYD
jgi:hypothetical protein